MSTNERSLADEAPAKDTSGQEASVAAERGPLSVDEFLSGVRAQRRSVRIRPNLHVLADLQRLVDEIDDSPEGADVDDLIDQYETARAAFEASERWVVEQRTPERRKHVRREAAKALGVDLREDGETVEGDDFDQSKAALLEAHVIADHIVEPEGVTPDQVTALYEATPGEFQKIDFAIVQVMRVLDEDSAADVLRDFSSRRSAKTRRS